MVNDDGIIWLMMVNNLVGSAISPSWKNDGVKVNGVGMTSHM